MADYNTQIAFDGINEGLKAFTKSREERQYAVQAAEGLLATYGDNPEFMDKFGDQAGKLHSLSTPQINAFMGSAAGLVVKQKTEEQKKLQAAQLREFASRQDDRHRLEQYDMAARAEAPAALRDFDALTSGAPTTEQQQQFFDSTSAEMPNMPQGVKLGPYAAAMRVAANYPSFAQTGMAGRLDKLAELKDTADDRASIRRLAATKPTPTVPEGLTPEEVTVDGVKYKRPPTDKPTPATVPDSTYGPDTAEGHAAFAKDLTLLRPGDAIRVRRERETHLASEAADRLRETPAWRWIASPDERVFMNGLNKLTTRRDQDAALAARAKIKAAMPAPNPLGQILSGGMNGGGSPAPAQGSAADPAGLFSR